MTWSESQLYMLEKIFLFIPVGQVDSCRTNRVFFKADFKSPWIGGFYLVSMLYNFPVDISANLITLCAHVDY